MTVHEIDALARLLCERHGGKWQGRKRAVWVRRALLILEAQERRQRMQALVRKLAEEFEASTLANDGKFGLANYASLPARDKGQARTWAKFEWTNHGGEHG